MEEDVLKKTCLFEAPKRPAKSGNVQKMVSEVNAFFTAPKNRPEIEEITLNDDDDENVQVRIKCKYCAKDITNWMKNKRETHQLECERIKKKSSLAPKITEEPPTKKWETSKDSVKFAKIDADDEANRRRKRPRSFAVVELAPRECQCEVLTTLHTRFMEKFTFSSQKQRSSAITLTEFSFTQQKMLKKISRLEQLSIDFRKMAEDSNPSYSEIMKIQGIGGFVEAPKLILKHRTTILTKNPKLELEFPKEILQFWLVFVFSAQKEWCGIEQAKMIREIGTNYGPVGLVDYIDEHKYEWRNTMKEEEEKKEEIEIEKIDTVEVVEQKEEEKEPDLFDTDDPLIGFNTEPMEIEPIADMEPMEVEVEIQSPRLSGGADLQEKEEEDQEKSLSQQILQSTSIIDDSFDNFIVPPQKYTSPEKSKSPQNQLMIEDSFDNFKPDDICEIQDEPGPSKFRTPETRNRGEKLSFASNVRILKTSNITPMPDFEEMTEIELKMRMKEIGQRPKGRKKMIEMLKMAYDTLHPEIVPNTPTIRPIVAISENDERPKAKPKKPSLNARLAQLAPKMNEEKEPEDEEDLGDKTLNLSNEYDDEIVGKIEEEEVFDKKDLGSMKSAFLQWIRKEANFELYNHMLSLNVVSLEELLARLGKSDGPESLIGKAKLAKILDELSITYQLPQKGTFGGAGGKRRGAFGRK
ncbi:unnamed protein product [Caenorhabditis angaria]|uniref:Uncharacterized protein n=1 Tax=Caenorhabditis angaria TaxID=860376 RepID=A0A9P1IGB8_9PELO|nr:unnamed protein product [Caenorhabditis angaria]